MRAFAKLFLNKKLLHRQNWAVLLLVSSLVLQTYECHIETRHFQIRLRFWIIWLTRSRALSCRSLTQLPNGGLFLTMTRKRFNVFAFGDCSRFSAFYNILILVCTDKTKAHHCQQFGVRRYYLVNIAPNSVTIRPFATSSAYEWFACLTFDGFRTSMQLCVSHFHRMLHVQGFKSVNEYSSLPTFMSITII